MRIVKVKVDCDLTVDTLEYSVNRYVDEFGRWPKAVIGPNADCMKPVALRATELEMEYYSLPEPVHLKMDAWAVVGEGGDTVWSPGA